MKAMDKDFYELHCKPTWWPSGRTQSFLRTHRFEFRLDPFYRQSVKKKRGENKNNTSYLIGLFRGSGDESIHVKCSLQCLHAGSSVKLAMITVVMRRKRRRRRRASNLLFLSIKCLSVEKLHGKGEAVFITGKFILKILS